MARPAFGSQHILILLPSTGGTAGQQPVSPITKLIGTISASSDDFVRSILIGTCIIRLQDFVRAYIPPEKAMS